MELRVAGNVGVFQLPGGVGAAADDVFHGLAGFFAIRFAVGVFVFRGFHQHGLHRSPGFEGARVAGDAASLAVRAGLALARLVVDHGVPQRFHLRDARGRAVDEPADEAGPLFGLQLQGKASGGGARTAAGRGSGFNSGRFVGHQRCSPAKYSFA
jgi:hypothetical protein